MILFIFSFSKKVEHELKPNGKNIKVTNENKKEFIEYIYIFLIKSK